jgi:hypothetical protein
VVERKRAPDRQVIGFYRAHLDQPIQLRAEDQECMRSKFNNPANVFLLLDPGEGRASGRFLFLGGRTVVCGLTFPFLNMELKTPTCTTLVGEEPKETRLEILLRHARASGSASRSWDESGMGRQPRASGSSRAGGDPEAFMIFSIQSEQMVQLLPLVSR